MPQVTSGKRLLYSSLAGDPDLREIVEMFVDEMPDRLACLLNDLNASNWEGLRRRVHQLKGAAGSYGFEPISQCAAQLDHAIRGGEPEQRVRDALDNLLNLCNRVRRGTPPAEG